MSGAGWILWAVVRDPPSGEAASAAPAPARFAAQIDVAVFQRGNLHTHTTRSDGDSPPEDVYAWYRDHGYAFVAVTDHNVLTDPAEFRHLERPGFVMVPGEEITTTVQGRPVHVNALCTRRTIGGGDFPTAAEALGWAVTQVHAQGGVALVNHPNFEWALDSKDLQGARGAELLEIGSGHPHVRTEGDALHPSHEALWEGLLGQGHDFAGVAVDDMHHLAPDAPDPASRPGRGFVEVFAPEATEAAICGALAKGALYASTGATLRRIAVGGDSMAVWPASPEARVEFLGAGGAVLAEGAAGADGAARYALRGGEAYVRARVTLPDGRRAWTRAYRAAR